MGTPPPSCLQSPDGQVKCGGSTNTRSGYLILAVSVLCSAWVPLCGVAAAEAAHDQNIAQPSIPGHIGGGGPGILGSRSGVIQRRDVSKQLLLPAPGATTGSPGNNSFTTTDNDETLASLETSRSGRDGAHSFLSKVTPPHWATADPRPTDPSRPPTTTTTTPDKASTAKHAITRSTIPEISIISTSTSTTYFSSPQHEVHRTSSSSPAISSSQPTSGREFPSRGQQQEDYYLRSTSSPTESDWSSGVTGYNNYTPTVSQEGKYLTTKEGFDGSNGSESNDRRESSVVHKPRMYLVFKCWSSSHTHFNSLEPAWVTDIGKRIVFPALLLVSWIFTSMALILHILVPDLRANMGQIFMCYVLALWLKCIALFGILFFSLCLPDFTNKRIVCIVLAFVSYMLSLAYRFWLNIMCFDIWRKVSHLARLEHVRPIKLWLYHLYGWGMPAMLGLMAWLISEFASDSFIKPDFNASECWFDHAAGAVHEHPWRTAAHSQYGFCCANKALLLSDATNQHS